MDDIAGLVAAVGPYLGAAIGAYGHAVFDQVSDEAGDVAAEATVGLGRRLLRRLLASKSGPAITAAVNDVVDAPADDDFQAALRGQVKKALAADADLAADVARLLPAGGVSVVAVGERSIAAHTISGVASTGDSATIQR
jgi:hypothetical protein